MGQSRGKRNQQRKQNQNIPISAINHFQSQLEESFMTKNASQNFAVLLRWYFYRNTEAGPTYSAATAEHQPKIGVLPYFDYRSELSY